MKAFVIAAMAATLFTASPVLAAEHGPKRAFPEGATGVERCEIGAEHAADRIARSEEKEADRAEKRANIEERLNTLADDADAAGVDTTNLRSYMDTAEGLADAVEAAHATWIAELTDLTTVECSEENVEEVKAEVAELKTAHQELRSAVGELRDYAKNTLRPEVKAVHNQIESAE